MPYSPWTPEVFGFTTPGSTTYNHQCGSYSILPDGTFIASFAISFDAGAFAASGAAGGLSIRGSATGPLPLTQGGVGIWDSGKAFFIKWDGLPYSEIGAEMPQGREGSFDLLGNASGVKHVPVQVGDLPKSGTVVLSGTLIGHT